LPAGVLAVALFLTPAASVRAGEIFVNPVYKGQDPYITRADDGYYYSASERSPKTTGIFVYKSRSLMDRGTRRLVYSAPTTGKFTSEYWAPEIHCIDGQWYIYTCADDGHNANHRAIVLKADTDDPQGAYHFAAELMTPGWAIDASVFRGANGKLYCVWSGWPDGPAPDSTQHLFISEMKSPTQLTGPAIDISGEMRDWERVSRPGGLLEGPQPIVRNGKTFIIYSASGSWTADYCLGLLTLAGDDPLDAAAWRKRDTPLFRRKGNVYGPGHCCLTTSPDGTEDWLVYHSSLDAGGSWNRGVSMKPITWNQDGSPNLGEPPQWGEAIAAPSGEPAPEANVMRADDFASDDAWRLFGGVRSSDDAQNQDGYRLRAGADPRIGDKALLRGCAYTDFTMRLRVRNEARKSRAGLLFRVSEPALGVNRFKGYAAMLGAGGKLELLKCDGEECKRIAQAVVHTQRGKWSTMRVSCLGPHIRVYVDDMERPMIDTSDATYTTGSVGVRGVNGDVAFDDFLIEPYSPARRR